MKVCWWWHNMILFLCQTLVEIIYLILIMLEDEHAHFIMCPLFLTERGFILANAISRSGKYADLCQYSFIVSTSKGMLFKSICCAYHSHHFSSKSDSLAKLILTEFAHQHFHLILCRHELLYFINLLKQKI